MFLDVGNLQRIDDPTPEAVVAQLHNLPAEAPFLILSADDEQFLQATPAGDGLRVEWRQESRHWFMHVNPEQAEEVFRAFCRWDEPAMKAFPWKRLTVWNDPYRRAIFVGLAFAAMALLGLWSAFRR